MPDTCSFTVLTGNGKKISNYIQQNARNKRNSTEKCSSIVLCHWNVLFTVSDIGCCICCLTIGWFVSKKLFNLCLQFVSLLNSIHITLHHTKCPLCFCSLQKNCNKMINNESTLQCVTVLLAKTSPQLYSMFTTTLVHRKYKNWI